MEQPLEAEEDVRLNHRDMWTSHPYTQETEFCRQLA